jgi:hypothetical protein
LTVQAPALASLTIAPNPVQGSATTSVVGIVTLSSPAPATGLVVTLKSSDTAAATVPAAVTVASGKLTASFTVTHKKVTTQTSVTITATHASVTKTADLSVTP